MVVGAEQDCPPFRFSFLRQTKKREKQNNQTPQPKPVSALWAADVSFLYPTTKRHQWNQRGALERPLQARACHSVEVSSYPGARSHAGKQTKLPVTQRRLISPRHRRRGALRSVQPQPRAARGDSLAPACYQGGKGASGTVSLNSDTCLSIQRVRETGSSPAGQLHGVTSSEPDGWSPPPSSRPPKQSEELQGSVWVHFITSW